MIIIIIMMMMIVEIREKDQDLGKEIRKLQKNICEYGANRGCSSGSVGELWRRNCQSWKSEECLQGHNFLLCLNRKGF